MQKITPFLWFDGKAEEAANFYASIFNNSKIVEIMRYGEAGPGPKGSVILRLCNKSMNSANCFRNGLGWIAGL